MSQQPAKASPLVSVLGLLAALGLIWYFFGRSTSTGDPIAPLAGGGGGGPTVVAQGQPGTVDGMTVTVLEATWSRGEEFIKPASGHVYVGFKVRLQATGSGKFASLADFSALADGTRQGQSAIAVTGWEPMLSIEQLQPGASIEGWVAFEVPEPSSFVRLVYDPNVLTDGPTLQFNAGCCKG